MGVCPKPFRVFHIGYGGGKKGGVCMSFGNQGFVLIVILFILLILVGCSCGF
ncbi:MAG: sporulation protein YjcZ [Caldibacillus debilis]|uniref:YjcZ family sporulation protein n=1 Tax=Caldibacillus debilis TaxID=301148 RepID=UPI000E3A121D|nr:YjcZ family sporulation protein [Caldibacillus debilis]REJ15117.1 MAG: sporulation protein YjcZ [Caldibacillus debilis]